MEAKTFHILVSPNENDSILESHFVFYYSFFPPDDSFLAAWLAGSHFPNQRLNLCPWQ